MEEIIDTAIKYNGLFIAGIKVTVVISLLSMFFGVILGTILSLMKIGNLKFLEWPATVYVEIIRGTPVLVQIALVFFGLPALGIQFPSFTILGIEFERMMAGVLALFLNEGAYVCEIIRSGILSIDKGQLEAARSLGFGKWEGMLRIIIPQAFKNILPVLGNEFITLIKTSSQVSVIGMADLMYSATTVQGISFKPFPPLVIVAVLYFIMTFIISIILKLVERNLRKSN